MIETFTPSRLRSNLYRILDRIIECGKPVEILRKGSRLRIIVERERKLDMIKPHPDYLKVPPDEIVHIDWSDEWRP